jgi:hypothetical protein
VSHTYVLCFDIFALLAKLRILFVLEVCIAFGFLEFWRSSSDLGLAHTQVLNIDHKRYSGGYMG